MQTTTSNPINPNFSIWLGSEKGCSCMHPKLTKETMDRMMLYEGLLQLIQRLLPAQVPLGQGGAGAWLSILHPAHAP